MNYSLYQCITKALCHVYTRGCVRIIVKLQHFRSFSPCLIKASPLNYWGRLKIAKPESAPPHPGLSELAAEPVGSICERLICDYPLFLSWIYCFKRKHLALRHRSVTSGASAGGLVKAGTPLRHNGAHSPRITPVDVAAGRLSILADVHGPHGAACYFMC